MTSPSEGDGARRPGRAERDAVRRRRRAAVFGETLPEGTSDERADAWGEREPGDDVTEEWLRRQVPPHHG